MWNPNSENLLLSVDELIEAYKTSVGRNANMLLGIVIDTAGLCPQPDVQRLKEFGDRLKKDFDKPLGKVTGNSLALTLDLKKIQPVNCIILTEDISKGERVRNYTIDAMIDGSWQRVGKGISIGHKRIQDIVEVKTSKLRLTVEAADTPFISNFSAYYLL